jgi:alpha-glucoside transport system substrate-binding protein
MSVVFISYRRADTQQAAGRLADRLIERFGRDSVVIDVDTDQVGRDYRTLITDHLERSGIVLVLVGEGFLAESEDGRRRIDQPNDLVRLELARALERDVPVIPVLVDGAEMPDHDQLPDDIADLVFRGSVELAHQRFDRDVAFLVERIERFFDAQRQAEEEAARREAEEAARLEAEEEARQRAEEEARLEAERLAREEAAREAARREAEEAARVLAEEEARLEAKRVAREVAAKEAERIAEEEARLEKAERARREAEAAAAAALQEAEEARRREETRVAQQDAVVAASGDGDDMARPAMATPGPGESSKWDWKRWGLVALAVVLVAGLAGIVVALAGGGDEGPATTAAAPSDSDDSSAGTEPPASTEPPAETAPPMTETGAAPGGFALEGTSVTVAGPLAADSQAGAIQEVLNAFAADQGMEITYAPEPEIDGILGDVVASDAPPDIVLVRSEHSVGDAARSGWAVPVPDGIAGIVADQWPADWTLLGAVEGRQFGVPTESELKSLVYYKPARFDALGYDIPRTWDELRALTERAVAEGNTPWCVGIESGDATGWVFTDWVEDLVLRMAGPDFYGAWTVHDVPFNSPEVEAAWREVLDLWNTPGAVYSGGTSIAEFSFLDNGFALAEDRCLMHRQANFLARPDWFPPGTTFGSDDGGIDVFYFPAMGDGDRPVLAVGTYALALRDAPEVWAVMEYLGSGEYAEARQRAQAARVDFDVSGFLSANTRQPLDVYRPVEQTMVGILWESEPMRFDASDLMPPEVGFGSFFFEGTRAVNGEVTVVDAIDAVEASWP